MSEDKSDIICHGQYVILQKKAYKKLHLLSHKTDAVFIGKDKVELDGLVGNKLGSTFKIVPKAGLNRQFTLQICTLNDVYSLKESLKDTVSCGADNRTICDDGSSQLLTSVSIEELRDSGTTPLSIIEQLVENSKTFQRKTEYSQEKYIEKKEKKYFEFITVKQPTIRILAEIFYNRDIPKSIGIRVDTLSQLLTSLSFNPVGSYLIVENGFRGIIAANLLNALSDEGRLVHITPDSQNQKQAVLAMNFPSSRLTQLVTIRLSTLSQLIKGKCLSNEIDPHKNEDLVSKDNCYDPVITSCNNDINSFGSNVCKNLNLQPKPKIDNGSDEVRKRKISNDDLTISSELAMKKPRWAIEAENAVKILEEKVDGLLIACKEFPSNILCKLLDYVLPSRPFVVYSLNQEPLVALYVLLKQRQDILYLRITETWFRPFQILPDRSHPVVTMSSSSGYLLSGLKLAT